MLTTILSLSYHFFENYAILYKIQVVNSEKRLLITQKIFSPKNRETLTMGKLGSYGFYSRL